MAHRWSILVGAMLACGHAAPAQARVSAVVVRWGEVELRGPGTPAPADGGTYIGRTVHNRRYEYLNWSTGLAARLCRGFAVELWVAAGPGEVVPDHLTLHMRHPLLTRPDGVSETEFTAPVQLHNGVSGEMFTFDEPWEAQPGEWTAEFLLGGEVLASKSFTVTPVPAGSPRSACVDVPQS